MHRNVDLLGQKILDAVLQRVRGDGGRELHHQHERQQDRKLKDTRTNDGVRTILGMREGGIFSIANAKRNIYISVHVVYHENHAGALSNRAAASHEGDYEDEYTDHD